MPRPAMTRRLTRPKRIAFATITVLVSLLITVAALGLVDELLRRHYSATLGLNRWGYRGRVVGRKVAHERRVVVAGGSTTFGYGTPPSATFPAQLERRLAARRHGTITVGNLGYPQEGAWSFG